MSQFVALLPAVGCDSHYGQRSEVRSCVMTFALLSSIDERANQVVAHQAAVKEAAAARQAALYASRKFHNFSADVDDLRGWMVDKMKTATDESYRDLTNLERKLQKHEAFERELHANEGQLRAVNKESIRDSIIVGNAHTKGNGFVHLILCNMKIAHTSTLISDMKRSKCIH